MAQPRPIIVTAAQVLARYLRGGYTPAEARARVERESGELTPGQYQSAIRYAQRLETIRQQALDLEPSQPLRDVLQGSRPPGAEVDVPVRIEIYQTQEELAAGTPTRYRTVYERARWSERLQDVIDRVMSTFLGEEDRYGEPAGYGHGFAGGFLFTGGYGATTSQP